MLVIEHLLGVDPDRDESLMRAVGRKRFRRLLADLASKPLITLPPGWAVVEGRVEHPASAAPGETEALMMPAGPRGGRLVG
jgi:hypothetical protein